MRIQTLTPRFLRSWPLPKIDPNADKESRGVVLVIAGSAELPGAALLASTAALRVGAGKLKLASTAKALSTIGSSIPEARLLEVASAKEVLSARGLPKLKNQIGAANSILVGPGLQSGPSLLRFAKMLINNLSVQHSLILDAGALDILKTEPRGLKNLKRPAILTPHAGEMASVTGLKKNQVIANPDETALEYAKRWSAIVILKGNRTIVASPDGRLFQHQGDCPGLATSGSGDVLAGVIAGLSAQVSDPLQAALWGVYLHAAAGKSLTKKIGRVGFLARELLDELPKQLDI